MQVAVFIAVSLDGFIARPDGAIDWLSVVALPGEDYGYRAFFDSVDALVVGRRTYEVALGFESWPYANKRCIVLTHRAPPARDGEEFFDGPAVELAWRLERDGVRRVYVDGGDVIRQFLHAGLVTDLTLSVIPVLLGDGVRLFGATGRDLPLRLVAHRGFSTGLVQIEYRL